MIRLTDEQLEVIVSLCEQADHRGHQAVVVVRLLVAADGLTEERARCCSQSLLHISEEGDGR